MGLPREVDPLNFIELLYNIFMKEITNYDLSNDNRLYQFFVEAYTTNEDVIIPKDLLKDFIHTGCRITICRDVFFKNK